PSRALSRGRRGRACHPMPPAVLPLPNTFGVESITLILTRDAGEPSIPPTFREAPPEFRTEPSASGVTRPEARCPGRRMRFAEAKGLGHARGELLDQEDRQPSLRAPRRGGGDG